MTNDPMVIVIHSPRDKTEGIDTIEEAKTSRKHPAMPLSEALAGRYKTYAHFAPYTVQGEKKWPRLNKPVLPELREAGKTVTNSVTALDWDSTGHEEIDQDTYVAIVKEILAACKSLGLPEPTYVYRTRAGARLLWIHPPLEPEKAEGFNRYLICSFLKRGILFDNRWPWNNLFALPHVVRDGATLDPEPIRRGPVVESIPEFDDPGYRFARALDHAQLRAPLPDKDDALNLVWRQGTGRLSPWGTKAVKRMRGRDAEVLFDYDAPPSFKKRNDALCSMIGSLVAMLYSVEGTTPEHVWGVVIPAAQFNTKPGDGRNLVAECWKMTCMCWAKEAAQHEVAAEDTRTFMDTLREGVKAWWATPPDDNEELSQALRRKLILAHEHQYFVLQQNGLYTPNGVKSPSIIPALRHSGLVGADRLLPSLEVQGAKGPVRMSGQVALESMGYPITLVELTGGPPEGGYLRPDGSLMISRYTRRTDIPWAYDQRVDDWITAMVGEEDKHRWVYPWIKAALSFELGPVAALSIQGVSGIGKDMFGLALAETITSRTCAGSEIFGGWQYFIDRSPFVWINEQNPPDAKGYDGRFRELVGGSYLTINQKHQAMVRVMASLRMLMTANSDLLVKKLYARRGMQTDEREATDLRLIHLDKTGRRDARILLAQKGSHAYTKGWVRSGNNPGDGVVAGHFLWVYQTVQLPPPGRFLLDGTIVPAHAFENEDIADLGEVLVGMFEKDLFGNGYVSASRVLEHMDNLMLTPPRKGFNLVSLGRCLAFFTKGPRKGDGRRRIDRDKLLAFAKHTGMTATKLAKEVGVGQEE